MAGKSSTLKIAKITAYIGVSLIALLGNVFVILIISRNKMIRKTINLFILNMAISDLSIPFIFVPMRVYSLYVEAIIGNTAWPFHGTFAGDFLCKVAMFLADSSPVISILSLVLMAADRFYAVVFPLKAPRVRFKTRVLLLVCSWVIAFISFAPYFHVFAVRKATCSLLWPNDHQRSMQIYSTILCCVFTLIPFILLSVMYSVMLLILRNQKIAQTHAKNTRRQRNNRNIVFMALAIVIVFAACWGPYNGFVFTATFVWKWKIPHNLQINLDAFFFTLYFLAACNAAINPCIYFIFIQKYRSALKRLFCGGKAPGFSQKNTSSDHDTNPCHLKRQLLASIRNGPGSSDKPNSIV